MNNSCSANVSKDIYCNKEHDICVEPYLPELQATVMLFVSILSCLLNGILILGTLKSKRASTSVKVLTITLSISHLLVAVYILPLRSVSVFYAQLMLPKSLCFLYALSKVFIFSLGNISLACISIDRYLAFYYPLTYPMIVTNGKLVIVVILVFILSIGISIPPIWKWGEFCFRPRTMPECKINYKGSLSYTLVVMLFIVVPIIIIFLCYLRISRIAKKHQKVIKKQKIAMSLISIENPRNTGNESPYGEDEKEKQHTKKFGSKTVREFWANYKTQKIVLLSTGATVVCWVPNLLTVIWLIFNRDLVVPYSVEFVVTLFAYFSCWINPLLFLLLNIDNKRFLKKLFRQVKGRDTNVDSIIISQTDFSLTTKNAVDSYIMSPSDTQSRNHIHRKLCRQ